MAISDESQVEMSQSEGVVGKRVAIVSSMHHAEGSETLLQLQGDLLLYPINRYLCCCLLESSVMEVFFSCYIHNELSLGGYAIARIDSSHRVMYMVGDGVA